MQLFKKRKPKFFDFCKNVDKDEFVDFCKDVFKLEEGAVEELVDLIDNPGKRIKLETNTPGALAFVYRFICLHEFKKEQ